ncbi:MAG: nickel pincer cofactor biosynthesis protein LarC [Methylacidiphilales bacterium]|nr:nickel pincer cofactor biosynthesis protein LarC [Candidatus Methylacidiphilales bacterium]
MANALYLDCFSGISGDMFLGACLDLGLPLEVLEAELKKLPVHTDFHLHANRATRGSIAGIKFDVHEHSHHTHEHSHHDHGHAHAHAHENHHHSEPHTHGRSYSDIRQLIESSSLSTGVKQRALNVFRRIGEAEAKIHGKTIEEIHFHEVGAIDSIVDITGACIALENLGIKKVLASPLADGRGTITCAHGVFPIPAPATLAILSGIPITQIDVPHELITPTGAALLAEFAESFAPLHSFTVEKIGYGLGSREIAGRPNVLRALLGASSQSSEKYDTDRVLVLETNLDDCSGETLGYLSEKLMQAGVYDVAFVPLTMKKSRPAVQLQVITPESARDAALHLIFSETTAFGLRVYQADRIKLQRDTREVQTPWGAVSVKIGRIGDKIVQISPEYESCRRIAEKHGVSLQEVYQASMAAARQSPET